MKVAYVQDWFTVDGGAEKVTRQILQLYPKADLFSLIDFMDEETRKNVLSGRKGKTTFLQSMPMARRYYRWYLPLFPLAIKSFDLMNYDLIISSSYSVAKGVKTGQGQRHVCYCHSPMRYAHDLKEEYLNDMAGSNPLLRFAMNKILHRLAAWDISNSAGVSCFIANSANVSERIRRLYSRESAVIHPPVNLSEFHLSEDKDEFYLTSSRLVPYKRVDLIIQAFRQMPDRKLVVTGSGPEFDHLRKSAASRGNIAIKGHVPREELVELMSRAKAFINASHEDLGLSVVEALASGTPVIAYGKGGVLETTEEGRSAIYFHEQQAEALVRAIEKFENSNLAGPEELRKWARSFDESHFRQRFKEEVERCLAN